MKRISLFVLAITVIATQFVITASHSQSAEPSSWPMLGGNTQRTYYETDKNNFLNSRLHPNWSEEMDHEIKGMIGNNTILFIILDIEKKDDWHEELVAYDTNTRKIIWSKTYKKIDSNSIVLHKNSVIINNFEDIVSLDTKTGAIIWEKIYKNRRSFGVEASRTFIVMSDKICVPLENGVMCLDVKNGDTVWNTQFDKPSPEDGLFVNLSASNNCLIYYGLWLKCLDINTGNIIWEQNDSINGYNVALGNGQPPIIIDEKCIVSIGGDIATVCVDMKDGEILWHIPLAPFDNRVGYKNFLLAGERQRCLDVSTGEEVWSKIDNIPHYSWGIGYNGNCLVYDNKYGKLVTIDFETGNLLWCQDVEKTYRYSQSIIVSDKIYVSLKNKLYCFTGAANSLTFQINSNTYKPDNGNTTEMDSKPTILQDRTLLPARYVTEPLGGEVFWDSEERKVTCKLVAPDNAETEDYKENVVELWIGKSTARVDGIEVQIDPNNPDVVPTIINDRTMVPMRFLAESLGCSVEWIANTKEIILTYNP